MAIAAAAVLAVAVGACGEERPEPPTPEEDTAARERLVGSEWRLAAIEPAEEEALEPSQDAREAPRVAFAADPPEGRRLEGHGGCNAFFGTYRPAPEGELTVRGLAATEEACMPPEVMEVESAFLAYLSDAETYRFEGDDLVIAGPLGVLRLAPLR